MTTVTVNPRELTFLEDEYALPIKVKFDFTLNSDKDLILPWFSGNKKPSNDSGCDALTMFLAGIGNNSMHTFRFNGYQSHPTYRPQLLTHPFRAEPGTATHMECEIDSTIATYNVDGKPYAMVRYGIGTIPPKGFIGFDGYLNIQSLLVENLEIVKPTISPPGALTYLHEEKLVLPATISFKVKVTAPDNFLIPFFTTNKKPVGDPECDYLTMYLGDKPFTFRYQGYKNFPPGEGAPRPFMRPIACHSERPTPYLFKCVIGKKDASYYIDGRPYARLPLSPDIFNGSEGYFGIDSHFNKGDLVITDNFCHQCVWSIQNKNKVLKQFFSYCPRERSFILRTR